MTSPSIPSSSSDPPPVSFKEEFKKLQEPYVKNIKRIKDLIETQLLVLRPQTADDTTTVLLFNTLKSAFN